MMWNPEKEILLQDIVLANREKHMMYVRNRFRITDEEAYGIVDQATINMYFRLCCVYS